MTWDVTWSNFFSQMRSEWIFWNHLLKQLRNYAHICLWNRHCHSWTKDYQWMESNQPTIVERIKATIVFASASLKALRAWMELCGRQFILNFAICIFLSARCLGGHKTAWNFVLLYLRIMYEVCARVL